MNHVWSYCMLRLTTVHPDAPPQNALELPVVGSKNYRGRKGRHCINLLLEHKIRCYKSWSSTFTKKSRLDELQHVAEDQVN